MKTILQNILNKIKKYIVYRLYIKKYGVYAKRLKANNTEITSANIWKEIGKDMADSFTKVISK